MTSESNDPRILIAMGEPAVPGGPPTVILGLTEATWNDLAGERAQDITLIPLGVYAQVLVMRGKDHEDIKRQLRSAAAQLDIPEKGLADLSVPTPKRH